MSDIFLKILNMSITASWLVLAILILRLALHKAPKWINCILWAIVALRLIMPFSLESIFSLVPSTETVISNEHSDSPMAIKSGISVIDNNIHAYPRSSYETQVNDTHNEPLDVLTIITIIWLSGIPIIALYGLISYIRVYRKVRISLLREDNIYYCDSINSPFILGIIKPKIYIPSGISDEHTENIIKHEKAHLKRKDHWWKPLGFALLTVYWFNPFMWLAYLLLCRDIEAACDEKVIKNMDDAAKKHYSETLLSCSLQRRMIFTCPLAFGEVGVKNRIKGILNYKKPAFWIVSIAVTASIVVAVCFLTNPIEKESEDTIQASNEKPDNDTVTPTPDNTEDNMSEQSYPDTYEVLVARFRVNDSMPEYVISAFFSDVSCTVLEEIAILDLSTRSEIQIIDVPYNEIFTDKAIYTLDVNFDGNSDLIIPRERPSGGAHFMAYVYDTETNEFIYAPSFENLTNFIIDNENKRILSTRTTSNTGSYYMSYFDKNSNDFVVSNSLSWESVDNNIYIVEEKANDSNELEPIKNLTIENINDIPSEKILEGFSEYLADDSFWDLYDNIWDNYFFRENKYESDMVTLDSDSPYDSPYLKYVDWEELSLRLNSEEKQLLTQYMPVLKEEEKFYYDGIQMSISELMRYLNPVSPRVPIINGIMFADVFQSGNKDLIIYHENLGWGYFILHYENNILYCINKGVRSFQNLQENGLHHGAGGASTGSYIKMSFANGICSETEIARYDYNPNNEYFYLYGEKVTVDEFELWKESNTHNDVPSYAVKPVEYSVLPLFNSFLKGDINAVDNSGNVIKINELNTDSYCQYTQYDMNGDNNPELCIRTSDSLSIFEIKDDNIVLWRKDSPYCSILNNSAILYELETTDPEHKTYTYYETDSNGNTVYEITFEEYENTNIVSAAPSKLFRINNQEVDEAEYISKTKAILNISDNLIKWNDI